MCWGWSCILLWECGYKIEEFCSSITYALFSINKIINVKKIVVLLQVLFLSLLLAHCCDVSVLFFSTGVFKGVKNVYGFYSLSVPEFTVPSHLCRRPCVPVRLCC